MIKSAVVRRDVWQQLSVRARKGAVTEKMVREIVEESCGAHGVPVDEFLEHLVSKLPFWSKVDATSRRFALSRYCTVAILNTENIFAACRPQL